MQRIGCDAAGGAARGGGVVFITGEGFSIRNEEGLHRKPGR